MYILLLHLHYFKFDNLLYYTVWSRSYCIVSNGGASIEVIKEYIENQYR
ncbi:MAG: transposase [Halanaerobiales bacterium]|nr:transposase [Halanaerobiales bacterium]